MINWQDTLITGGTDEFVNPINPSIGSQVTIRLKVYKINPIEFIYVRIAPNGEEINLEMHKSNENDFFSVYEVSLPIVTKITHYRFGIVTKDEFFWFNNHLKLD